jgi:hypothetical protein
MPTIHRTGPTEPVTLAVTLNSTVPAATILPGDATAVVSGKALAATSFTWTTDLATTQTNFAAALGGIASGRSRAASTDPRDLEVQLLQDGNFEVPLTVAAASAYLFGTYVGLSKDTGNNLKQTYEAVATKARAVGVVVKEAPIGSTTVLVRLINTAIKR